MFGRGKTVCGTRQSEKALLSGIAVKLYVAKDADPKVVQRVIDLAGRTGIEIVYVDTMAELGKARNLRVGSAAACLLKE